MRMSHHEEREVLEGEMGFSIQNLRALCVLRGERNGKKSHHEEHEGHEGDAGSSIQNLRGERNEVC